ncbi:MAG: hypothetical protein R2861_03540 [Desulfobacterales bacterium]
MLTKIDMVDAEWAELVREDLQEFVDGTFLEDAPVIPVSSITGQGIPELIRPWTTTADHLRQKTG